MNTDTFIEWLRLIDALLASVVFALIVFRTKQHWYRYRSHQKMLILSYLGFALATAYTSFELYQQNVEVGFRSFIVLAANILALYALSTNKEPGLLGFEKNQDEDECDSNNNS